MQICLLGQIIVDPTVPGLITIVVLCENWRQFFYIIYGTHYVNVTENSVAWAHHHYKWMGGSGSMQHFAQGLWPVIFLALLLGPCVH